jgi:hypothetical protein
MRAHNSGRVKSFVTMREMQCAGVRSYILQGTMSAMQCVPSSRKTYPCQTENLHESRRMGRRIVVMKLICWLGHCKCDGHTVHKFSQRRRTADWLAPRESECSRIYSKVFSDWLPSYIKATRPVLEIFKMAGYFPDIPRFLLLWRSNTKTSYWGSVNDLDTGALTLCL